MHPEKPQQSNRTCLELFKKIFPDAKVIINKIAPDGWDNSPWFYVFHPTPEQRYKEAMHFYERTNELFSKKGKSSEKEPPKLSDYTEKSENDKILPKKEAVELMGYCLWDIFSNNHEVTSEDGNMYDIGSFRGSAGFIAEYINMHHPAEDERYDYINFYMGTIWINNRADLTHIYEWIFSMLKSQQCDWIYSFPRIYAISPDEIKEGLGLNQERPEDYNPHEAILEEAEKEKRKKDIRKTREEFDKIYKEEVEEAKNKPLPKVVKAYKDVYKTLPKGWPHKNEPTTALLPLKKNSWPSKRK